MERLFSWKRLIYLLVAATIVYALYLGKDSETVAATIKSTSESLCPPPPPPEQPTIPFEPPQPVLPVPPTTSERLDDFSKNPDFDGLTAQQCTDTFPDLYFEVNRAVKYWQDKGHTISEDDVEVSWRKWDGKPMGDGSGGAMRFLIHDNELRILESEGTIGHWGFKGRGIGFLYLLQRAIDSAVAGGETLPTIEAALVLEDIVNPPNGKEGTHSFWTWTNHVDDETHLRHFLIPNYDLWYGFPMGSFREAKRRAMERDAPFSEKIQKAVWRGTGFLNPGIREKLVEVSEGKDWSDIAIADMGGMDSDVYLTIEDMCNYAIAVHTEGVSYSGRLSYLLNCNSLPIIHDLEWSTFTTHLLKHEGPEQNYVKVSRDWEELEASVQHYLDHPDEAEKIIENSLATFRDKYLSRAAVSCYLRKLIHGYSSVAFTPEVHRPPRNNSRGTYRRGISFERFMDDPQDANFEEDDKWF